MDQSKTAGDPGQKRTDDSWQDHGVTDGKDYGTALLVEGKRKKYLIQIIKVCLMNY